MSALLFGQPGSGCRREWNASDFTNVDDTVRGGSSSSAMKVVPKQEKGFACSDEGAIDFSGFLDITTLGGAGFASQAYTRPLPGPSIDASRYAGLRLVGRYLGTGSSASSDGAFPGGGKGPVTSYVVNLKTEEPKRRPDGRRESQVAYEWHVDLASNSQDSVFDVQSAWHDFRPTYRGRPAPGSPPLDPSQVKEWSIMARSDFGNQSGKFAVRLLSISAVPTDEKLAARDAAAPSYVVAMDGNTSGEYYGFALFIVATVAMVLWVVWALTPDHLLQRVGIEWYPNREWAFLLPAWSLFAVLFVYVAFMTLNTHNNPDLNDLSHLVDSHSNILPLDPMVRSGQEPHPLHGRTVVQTGVLDGPMAQEIYDIPPGLVSRERHGL